MYVCIRMYIYIYVCMGHYESTLSIVGFCWLRHQPVLRLLAVSGPVWALIPQMAIADLTSGGRVDPSDIAYISGVRKP